MDMPAVLKLLRQQIIVCHVTQEVDVRDYWNYCGEIEAMDLMRFPDTGRFKGIAFITFAEVLPSSLLCISPPNPKLQLLSCPGLQCTWHGLTAFPAVKKDLVPQ